MFKKIVLLLTFVVVSVAPVVIPKAAESRIATDNRESVAVGETLDFYLADGRVLVCRYQFQMFPYGNMYTPGSAGMAYQSFCGQRYEVTKVLKHDGTVVIDYAGEPFWVVPLTLET